MAGRERERGINEAVFDLFSKKCHSLFLFCKLDPASGLLADLNQVIGKHLRPLSLSITFDWL